jgi:ornithine--oxo-acid transaminase
MSKNQALMEVGDRFGARNYHPLPIIITKAEGCWVEDDTGNRYLDMLSAYSALNHGHRHPRIIQSIKDQLDKVTLTSRAFQNDQLATLNEKIARLTGKELVLVMNTGAEAVETALKAIRRWAYEVKHVPQNEAEIIVCTDNFHGRTISVVSCSSNEEYKRSFGPFTPGFKIVPYGDIDALKQAITKNTAAFLLEPMQGEAGVIAPLEGYLAQAYALCKDNDFLFVADEIQTGLGRTGQIFACDWEDVHPDIYIMGKALGGGIYPISAVAADEEILGLFEPGSHGSTLGGNPLACRVAITALDVFVDEELPKRSRELGKYFKDELLKISNDKIKEIRGKGLFIGMELKEAARPYCERLMEEGVLCKETHINTIRFAPPLVISKEDLDFALTKVRKIFAN